MIDKIIKNIIEILENKKGVQKNYHVPKIWLEYYEGNDPIKSSFVNPSNFYIKVLKKDLQDLDENKISQKRLGIYAMHIRTTTCWDHDNDGKIKNNQYTEVGTFMKSILMLPLLNDMGIEFIHLLPIFQISEYRKKGEVGSPYSVKHFFELDSQLEDSFFTSFLNLEEQFKLFVDIAHAYNLKIILDFPLRTMSRDNELIKRNPEALFWINKKYEKTFSSPIIENIPKETKATKDNIHVVYESNNIQKYTEQFVPSPNIINPKLFRKILEEHYDTADILRKIENKFSITTAPAFSDCINDSQAQWSDITYLKIYEDQKQYFLFDTINSNYFTSGEKIKDIWEYLSSIIPYYQKKYKIDGARIDMAHSLPEKLIINIRQICKNFDENFVFLCENLFLDHISEKDTKLYDFFVGNLWYSEQFRLIPDLVSLLEGLSNKNICFLATSGLSDTPRLYGRYGNKRYEEQMIALNYFLPNTVPYLLSGIEIFEMQPMNLGLISEERDRFVLPKKDEMYGKLALFDNYQLHWNFYSKTLVSLIKNIKEIRMTLENVVDFSKFNIKFDGKVLNIYFPYINTTDYLEVFVVFSNIDNAKNYFLSKNIGNNILYSNISGNKDSLNNLEKISLIDGDILIMQIIGERDGNNDQIG